MGVNRQFNTPRLPGMPAQRMPDARDRSHRRRIKTSETEIEGVQNELRVQYAHFRVSHTDLTQFSTAGVGYYGMLTLPPGGGVLDCWAWVREPFRQSGAPRGGFVAVTAINASVGTLIGTTRDVDAILEEQDIFALTPTWDLAADKGVLFGADYRTARVPSFSENTRIQAAFSPNANGDFTLMVAGLMNIIIAYVLPSN